MDAATQAIRAYRAHSQASDDITAMEWLIGDLIASQLHAGAGDPAKLLERAFYAGTGRRLGAKPA